MTWVGFWPVPSQLSPALVTLPLTLPVALALTAGTTIGGWGVVLLTYLPGLHGAGAQRHHQSGNKGAPMDIRGEQ